MVPKNRKQHASYSTSILVGLIGDGIQASRTPAMHEREGRAGPALSVQVIDLEKLDVGTGALPDADCGGAHGLAGLNITYPCKQSVIPLLTTVDDARALGG